MGIGDNAYAPRSRDMRLCWKINTCVCVGKSTPPARHVEGLLVVLVSGAGGADFPTQTQVEGLLVVLVWRAGGVGFPT